MNLRDIALKATVHPATVSRALRNDPCISAEVRSSIQRLAKRLRYRVNPLVAALMRNRRRRGAERFRGTLACVTAYGPEHSGKMQSLLKRFLLGMVPKAAELGYVIDHLNVSPQGMSALRLESILKVRRIDGVILGPARSIDETVGLDLGKFSSIALGLSHRNASLNWVSHDHFSAMRMILQRCRDDYGFRRVGLVLSRRVSEKVDQRWLAAYLLGQGGERTAALRPLIFEDEIDTPGPFLAWMERHHPDVVIGLKCGRIAGWLKDAGWDVPGEVGCVSLDCADEPQEMTGVVQDYAQIGATAVDLLVGMVERHEASSRMAPIHALIDGGWRPGATAAVRLIASPA